METGSTVELHWHRRCELLITWILPKILVSDKTNTPFTRSSIHRANIELAQAGLLDPTPWLKCRPGLGSYPTADHVLYRSSNYKPPTLLISMLITIERPASCSMFARSCKRGIIVVVTTTNCNAAGDQMGGFAALHYSAGLKHKSGVVITQLLLSAGVDPDIRATADDSYINRLLVGFNFNRNH